MKVEDILGKKISLSLAKRLADEKVRVHNELSKQYTAIFKQVGARMWRDDDCHPLKENNRDALAKNIKEATGNPKWTRKKIVDHYSFLPVPLTVMDSYPEVTAQQRAWVRDEIEKLIVPARKQLKAFFKAHLDP